MDNHNNAILWTAAWSAAIGSLTFISNILKWRQEKPRLMATIVAVKSFWNENDYSCIRLTLRNRGQQRTVVEEVYFYERPSCFKLGWFGVWLRLTGENAWCQRISTTNRKTAKLPAVLNGNDVWTGFLPLEANDEDNDEELRQVYYNKELLTLLRQGSLRFSIRCAHTHRQNMGKVRIADF